MFYKELNTNYRIVSQTYPNHLQKDPHTGVHLNYGAVNDNNKNHGNKKAKYDYTINNAADLSKLFLQTFMAHYTAFDEACDSSALLGSISKIAKFDPVIKSDAGDVCKVSVLTLIVFVCVFRSHYCFLNNSIRKIDHYIS